MSWLCRDVRCASREAELQSVGFGPDYDRSEDGVQSGSELSGRADLGDVYNLYLILLGRSPESRKVVREKAGSQINALLEAILGCFEFQEGVLGPTIRRGALPEALFLDAPGPGLRHWAAARLAKSRASRTRIQHASTWPALLGAVLTQPDLSSLLRKISGDRAAYFESALLRAERERVPPRTPERVPYALKRALFRLGLAHSRGVEQRLRIVRSGLFDARFYRAEYPDVAERREDPLTHFMTWGALEGRRPNVLFDTHWYLARHSDLVRSRINPLLHYLESVGDETSFPNPLFDRAWYLARYPDVASTTLDALAHFFIHGAAEGRSPHPAFDLPFYVSSFPEGIPENANPLEYYLENGRELGHEPHPIFDTDRYLRRYSTADSFVGNPLVHYLAQGPSAAVDPSDRFSTAGYLHTYPEVRVSGDNALVHYLKVGRKEGREALLVRRCDLPLRVAIIAEVSLPQCLKYRVVQKMEMLVGLGHGCSIINWRDLTSCVDALRTHNMFIFYRVPGYPEVLEIMNLVKRAGLPILWEVDDIIFSGQDYATNQNLLDLDPELLRSVMSGVPLYRKALLACGAGLASTPGVAQAMRRVGVDTVFLVENALDAETIRLGNELTATPASKVSEEVVIIYGSGGKTHDADFSLVTSPLLAVLRTYRHVKLRVVGDLNLQEAFAELDEQVECIESLPFAEYMKLLAQSDVAICPVENTVFSDAKSNIKFLEAAAVGVPSICSPRSAYQVALRDGKNGLFAEGEDEWILALTTLIEDAALRRRLGDQARSDVHRDYDPATIASTQLAPVLQKFTIREAPLRILSVNTYYNPQSYGGATIVAEQLNKRLNARPDTQVTVFTGYRVDTGRPYRLSRDVIDGCVTFRMEMPPEADPAADFDNASAKEPFRDALRASGANVVHLHAIQGLSATLLEVCVEEGVPAVVTLHDAWWICGRMFMVTGRNRYCGQWKIDVDVCATCVDDAGLNYFRQIRLASLLDLADLTLTPSGFFRDLYIANGISPERVVVNRNGVQSPISLDRKPRDKLRLGFVGGIGAIKGIEVIRAALEDLPRDDYRLILVDNTLNLGFSSMDVSAWKIKGETEIVPAYTQATMDAFFSEIDVLLFPTQWKESFGLTVREALIRDVWVIATDAGGVTEDILEGVNGDIIPFGDDGTELRVAISRRLQLGAAGRAHSNPEKARIATFEMQAEELHDLLEKVARSDVRSAGSGRRRILRPSNPLAVTERRRECRTAVIEETAP